MAIVSSLLQKVRTITKMFFDSVNNLNGSGVHDVI